MKNELLENIEQLTDDEIMKIDFYDFCGINSLYMTDLDKIEYYRNMFENQRRISHEQARKKTIKTDTSNTR